MNAAGIATAAAIAASSVTAGSLGPERVVKALRGQLAEHYVFVVSFHRDVVPDDALPKDAITATDVVDLPLLNGFAATLQVSEAIRLADIKGIEWVWYLHPDEAEITKNVVLGVTYAMNQGARIFNMSLGPPSGLYRKEPDFEGPVPRATQMLAREGRLAVTAIGNTGKNAPGFVNPWSTPPWVVSVGAWDRGADTVWEHSSTGDPKVPHTWPDVIADGVDVIGAMTTAREKTDKERAYDEGNATFRKRVPKDAWDLYTLRSGSSMAARKVSGAAIQVAHFIEGIIREKNPEDKDRLFSFLVGPERISAHDNAVPRLTGRATSTPDGGMEYTYWMDAPWKMIKQVLVDTALPLPDAPPWQAGAGVVDPDYINARFGVYGIAEPQVLAAKVLE